MDLSRIIFYGVWGIGVFLVYLVVAICRYAIWRHHHDRRSFRDFLEGFALWIVSAAASFAVASVLLYPDASTVRGALNALALGAFFAAGLVMAGDAYEQYRRLRR